MAEHTPNRFRITWGSDSRYYVSIPNYNGGEVVPASVADDLVKALEKLSLAYVNLLELGRDRIIALGGTCDPVDVMEAGDPSLRAARDVIGRVKGAPKP